MVDKTATSTSNLVARNLDPPAPDLLWAGDITYIPTGEGSLYLSTVLDLYSRRLIWGLADRLPTDLASVAFEMAVATRGGVTDLVSHSDYAEVSP